MPRIVKAPEVRRSEILDAAQRLFISRGYETTTVNDLLEAVGLSKGAFYHHFASKEEVMEALGLRIADQSLARLAPVFERPGLAPLERLKAFFHHGQQFKKENAPVIRALSSFI